MRDIQVAKINIKNDGGTYLQEGSVLPVVVDQENRLWAVEQYEPEEEPCYHELSDLTADGVVFTLEFIKTGELPQ